MTILGDFKKFVFRGNVIDLAVGVIIGAAFGKVVTSLVNNIFMPPIGYVTGNTDFNNLKIIIKNGTTPEEEVAIKYGAFIQDTVDFLIIAFCVFILITLIGKLQRLKTKEQKEEELIPKPPPAEEVLLAEIRDILRARPTIWITQTYVHWSNAIKIANKCREWIKCICCQ